eukprot:scaffold22484_cov60-Phaeocystis_antarctica.AAC.7
MLASAGDGPCVVTGGYVENTRDRIPKSRGANCHQCRAAARHSACTWSGRRRLDHRRARTTRLERFDLECDVFVGLELQVDWDLRGLDAVLPRVRLVCGGGLVRGETASLKLVRKRHVGVGVLSLREIVLQQGVCLVLFERLRLLLQLPRAWDLLWCTCAEEGDRGGRATAGATD